MNEILEKESFAIMRMKEKRKASGLFYIAAAVLPAALTFLSVFLVQAQRSETAMDIKSDIQTDTVADPAMPAKGESAAQNGGQGKNLWESIVQTSAADMAEEALEADGIAQDETVLYEKLDQEAFLEITKRFQNKMAGDVYIEVRDADQDIILPADLPETIRMSGKNLTMAFVNGEKELEYAYGIRYKDIPRDAERGDVNLKFDIRGEDAYPDTKRLVFRQEGELPFPLEITLFENESLTDYHIYTGDFTALSAIGQEKSASDGYLAFTVETLEPLIISSTDIETALEDPIEPPAEESLTEKLSPGFDGFSLSSPLMIVSLLILLIGVIMAVYLFIQRR